MFLSKTAYLCITFVSHTVNQIPMDYNNPLLLNIFFRIDYKHDFHQGRKMYRNVTWKMKILIFYLHIQQHKNCIISKMISAV